MGRKGMLDVAVPRLKQHMAEVDIPLTLKEIAEFLGVSESGAHNVLIYMEEVMGIIQKVKRGRNFYFLNGAFDEGRLAAMLEKARPSAPRRRRATPRKRRRTDSALDEYLASMRVRASSGDGLSALAIIGLSQPEAVEPRAPPPEPRAPSSEPTARSGHGTPIFITSEPCGCVKSIPKDYWLLTLSQTKYLKEHHLRGLDGYEEIERLKAFFASSSALERRVYGHVFYASMGTNPWDRVYKVTAERVQGAEM